MQENDRRAVAPNAPCHFAGAAGRRPAFRPRLDGRHEAGNLVMLHVIHHRLEARVGGIGIQMCGGPGRNRRAQAAGRLREIGAGRKPHRVSGPA